MNSDGEKELCCLAKRPTHVVIIGAGPAGTATAIQCAMVGLNVTVVERESFLRHRPGETLHPGVEPLFSQLGVAKAIARADFPRHEGHWLCWSGVRRFQAYGKDSHGPWKGFQAWRGTLDSILLQRARSLGTKVLQPCRCIKPLIDHGRIAGILLSSGPLFADYVVDAAGGSHWLARRIGLHVETRSPPLIADYGYVQGPQTKHFEQPLWEADRAGWSWMAQVRPGCYHWTRLNLHCRIGSTVEDTPRALRRLGDAAKRFRADVTWRRITRPAGPGYFLAGDAAMVVDPASSHGVLRALMSGMMVGHLIAQSTSKRQQDFQSATWYCGWMQQWFENDVRRLAELYAKLPLAPAWCQRDLPVGVPNGATNPFN
jgi:flavin-dependent dehydrogenase